MKITGRGLFLGLAPSPYESSTVCLSVSQTLTGDVLLKPNGKTQPYQCMPELFTGKTMISKTSELPLLKSVHPKLLEGKSSSTLTSTVPESRESTDTKTDVLKNRFLEALNFCVFMYLSKQARTIMDLRK